MKDHHVKSSNHLRILFVWLVGIGAVAVALLWGWNTFAVEMLGQQAMKFKHAVALEILFASVSVAFSAVWRLFKNRTV
jgi:hypothetical protein